MQWSRLSHPAGLASFRVTHGCKYTLVAETVLTQHVEGREASLGYSSKRCTRTEERLSPDDRGSRSAAFSGALQNVPPIPKFHSRNGLFSSPMAIHRSKLLAENALIGDEGDAVW